MFWLLFILISGVFGDANLVLGVYEKKSLKTSLSKNGLYYGNDPLIQKFVKDLQGKELIEVNGKKLALDKLFINNESSDATICEMIHSTEDKNTFLINDIALSMPLMAASYLVNNRGGSSALQSAIAKIMRLNGIANKPLEVIYTAAVSNQLPKKTHCQLILANIQGRIDRCNAPLINGRCPAGKLIVRYNIQGAEQNAAVLFQKPVDALNVCQKAVLAASFNEDLSVFNWYAKKNVNGTDSLGIELRAKKMLSNYAQQHLNSTVDLCDEEFFKTTFKTMQTRLQKEQHWLPRAKKLLTLNAPIDTNPDKVLKFNNSIQKILAELKKNKGWSEFTDLDVSIHRNGKPYLKYGSTEDLRKFGAGSHISLGSIAKLLALHVASEQHKMEDVVPIAIPNIKNSKIDNKPVSLANIYCHSFNEGAYGLVLKLDQPALRDAFKKFGFKTEVSDINIALSTERTNASTSDLQGLLFEMANSSVKNKSLRQIASQALETGCTLDVLKPLMTNKIILLAKTGTYDAKGVIHTKAAVWGFQQPKSKDIYTVVVRLIQPTIGGICHEPNCITKADLLPLYKQIMVSL